MTHDEFLSTLTVCAAQYQWWLDHGMLRTKPLAARHACYCPITLVCWHTMGEDYPITEWAVAAARLGLNEPRRFVYAADSELLSFDTEDPLRMALLTAVGLAPNSEEYTL